MASWLVAPQCTNPAAFSSDLATACGERFDQRDSEVSGESGFARQVV